MTLHPEQFFLFLILEALHQVLHLPDAFSLWNQTQKVSFPPFIFSIWVATFLKTHETLHIFPEGDLGQKLILGSSQGSHASTGAGKIILMLECENDNVRKTLFFETSCCISWTDSFMRGLKREEDVQFEFDFPEKLHPGSMDIGRIKFWGQFGCPKNYNHETKPPPANFRFHP